MVVLLQPFVFVRTVLALFKARVSRTKQTAPSHPADLSGEEKAVE